jgi:hypothetical protein
MTIVQKILNILKKAKEYLTKGMKTIGELLGIIDKAEEQLERFNEEEDKPSE